MSGLYILAAFLAVVGVLLLVFLCASAVIYPQVVKEVGDKARAHRKLGRHVCTFCDAEWDAP